MKFAFYHQISEKKRNFNLQNQIFMYFCARFENHWKITLENYATKANYNADSRHE